MQELLARIRVALRHDSVPGSPAPVFERGGLKVDLERRLVFRESQEVHLTPTEYKLLATLVRHAGKVLTHRQLLHEVWGANYEGADPLPAGLHGAAAPEAGAGSRPAPRVADGAGGGIPAQLPRLRSPPVAG